MQRWDNVPSVDPHLVFASERSVIVVLWLSYFLYDVIVLVIYKLYALFSCVSVMLLVNVVS